MIIGVLLLAGCGTADTEVTLYEGEKWQCVGRLVVPVEMVEMEGGEEDLDSRVLSILEEYREAAPEVEISWDKEYEGQDVVYCFTLDGTGWELLDQLVFRSAGSIVKEDGKVHIRYLIPAYEELEELVYSSFTLKGGKIISSNADETIGGSAIWHNPMGTTIEAVLVEKAQTNWLVIVCFALVFAVAGTMIFRSLRRLEPARR